MDMSAISTAGQSLLGLRQIAATLLDIRDFAKLAGIQTDMQQRILDVQGAMLDMQVTVSSQLQTIDALKEEIAKLKKIAAERENYALHEIRSGAFVYRYKGTVDDSHPAHYLCQPCYDNGDRGVLEARNHDFLGPLQWCPTCQRSIYLETRPSGPIVASGGRSVV